MLWLTQSPQIPLSGRLHRGTPLLATAPIAALPPERARLCLSAGRGRRPTELRHPQGGCGAGGLPDKCTNKLRMRAQ